ncbi:DUF6816 family protein [Mastigocoleus testarum]|uniref:DUF6816 domain-containing protein n=1 Tax=Mastigocoleus testarum BC008 TaxID=371196 RepID=A0A0V7ZU54_9CYAN|nr:hypothetical protein [Mastigocoleus testarum]KST67718.1 hypothetical protein BC008_43990 [Mastigocoleus testarum BC008]
MRLIGVVLLILCCLIGSCLIGSQEANAGELELRIANFPQWEKIKAVKSAEGELVYPDWMEGNWQLKSTLVDLAAPLAPDIITPGFEGNRRYLQEPISFPVKFVPQQLLNLSLQTTAGKESKVSEIVADRAFNSLSLARAYLGERTVLSVKVDPDSSLRQVTFLRGKCPNNNYGQRRCDRQLVSVVKSRATEYTGDGQFITCEVFQQFFKGTDRPYFNTVESTTAYRQLPKIQPSKIQPSKTQQLKTNQPVISAEQVTAVYLSPQDPNYFKAGSRPVALYKYHLDFYR